jgi:chemotaxis protein MotB
MARGKTAGRYSPNRRDRKGGDDGSADRWLGTYGDAITLLMAFFVMLYAMAETDVVKFTAFVSGLEGPFGNMNATEMLERGPALVGEAGAEEPSRDPGAVTRPPGVVVPLGAPEILEEMTRAQRDQLEEVEAMVQTALAAAGMPAAATTEVARRGLTVSIAADDILFPSGSAAITAQGRALIGALGDPLRTAPNEVLIEGHTDDVPLRRDGYSNWNLSTDRAVSVLELLVTDIGLAQQRLGAAGYGEFRPRVPNTDAASRALNRRVDIVFVVLPENAP